MSQIQKLVEKFLKNPNSLSYSEIHKVLSYFNFEKIDAKGSHVKYKHSHFAYDLIIPVHNGDCKSFYKKEAMKRVQKIQNKK